MYVYFLPYYDLRSSLSCMCLLRDGILRLRIKIVLHVTHVFNDKTRNEKRGPTLDL